MTRMSK